MNAPYPPTLRIDQSSNQPRHHHAYHGHSFYSGLAAFCVYAGFDIAVTLKAAGYAMGGFCAFALCFILTR